MEMGSNFCQILELGGTTIKGRRVLKNHLSEDTTSTDTWFLLYTKVFWPSIETSLAFSHFQYQNTLKKFFLEKIFGL